VDQFPLRLVPSFVDISVHASFVAFCTSSLLQSFGLRCVALVAVGAVQLALPSMAPCLLFRASSVVEEDDAATATQLPGDCSSREQRLDATLRGPHMMPDDSSRRGRLW